MQPVAVRILHPAADPAAGPLAAALADARARNAGRLAGLFAATGATDVEVVGGAPDGVAFGPRLRALASGIEDGTGLVVLGSGSIPLATRRDAADFLNAAGSGERRALANNRYSADVLAIGRPATLAELPDLPGDNALPRWLEEVAGFAVDDLRSRWRLSVDLDSPLDVLLVDPEATPAGAEAFVVRDAMTALRALASDRRAELVVAGRTSAATLRWLERSTRSRTRALVEERGLRASARAAVGDRAAELRRPPRSILGLALDDRGPEALGSVLAELGDGAIVDSRVLLAHQLGADEATWPAAEDRFASDLLLPDRIADPWLRAISQAAVDAPIPILLGGHSLVGPGIRLLLGRRR